MQNCLLSFGDNLHKCQSLFSRKNKKIISVCRLLKILPKALSVKSHSGWILNKQYIGRCALQIYFHWGASFVLNIKIMLRIQIFGFCRRLEMRSNKTDEIAMKLKYAFSIIILQKWGGPMTFEKVPCAIRLNSDWIGCVQLKHDVWGSLFRPYKAYPFWGKVCCVGPIRHIPSEERMCTILVNRLED